MTQVEKHAWRVINEWTDESEKERLEDISGSYLSNYFRKSGEEEGRGQKKELLEE